MVTYGRLDTLDYYFPESHSEVKSVVSDNSSNKNNGVLSFLQKKENKNVILRDKLKVGANIIGGVSSAVLFWAAKQTQLFDFINSDTLQVLSSGLFSYNYVRYYYHKQKLIDDLDDTEIIEEFEPVKKLTR